MQWLPILVGAGMMASGLWLFRKHRSWKALTRSAEQWPRATGRLLALKRVGRGSKRRDTGDYERHSLTVSYDYRVNGSVHTNDRIVFGSDIVTTQETDAFCAQFSTGQTIEVIYDPNDPTNSVLLLERPGGKSHPEGFMAVILTVVGAMVIVANGWQLF